MNFLKKNKHIRVIIIGKNSFIAKNYFKYSKLKKKITLISHKEINKINFEKYTHLINFSYDPKIKNRNYYKTNLIDKKICSLIKNNKLIYIYPSSRAVFKINKTRKFYGKNKLIIERLIKKSRNNRYLILRISNLLEFNHEDSNLFISQLLNSLKKFNLIKLDLDKKTYKDFIPLYFFSRCLDSLINMNITGIFNVSSGKKIKVYELAKVVVNSFGKGKIVFLNKLYKDSFVLNNSKLKKTVKIHISKKEILDYCHLLGKKLKKYA